MSARNLVSIWGLALAACSSGPIGPSETSLEGVWHASRMEYVSKAGAGQVEVISQGWVATLTLNSDRTGSLVVTPVALPGWSWNGAWEVAGDLFRLAGQGADVSLAGGQLTLRGFDGMYDFDGDETPDPAKFNFVMVR